MTEGSQPVVPSLSDNPGVQVVAVRELEQACDMFPPKIAREHKASGKGYGNCRSVRMIGTVPLVCI